MARWLVRLSGERFDVEEFPRNFPSGDVFAIWENELVFLVGPRLDTEATAEAVAARAAEELDRLTGVLTLLYPTLKKPAIDQVIRETDEGRQTFALGIGRAIGRSKVHGVSVTHESAGAPSLTSAQQLLAPAAGDERLKLVLTLWGHSDRTWPRLYRVLEELEEHLGMQVDKAGLCTRAERSRFTQTANSAKASGVDSRHADKYDPPDKPMTQSAGADFVGHMIRAVLRK